MGVKHALWHFLTLFVDSDETDQVACIVWHNGYL